MITIFFTLVTVIVFIDFQLSIAGIIIYWTLENPVDRILKSWSSDCPWELHIHVIQFQSPLSVDLNNKRTTSPKGGKDWVLVKFLVQNQHNFH